MRPSSFSFGIEDPLIIEKTIKKQARKRKEIIYGARAMQRQLQGIRILRQTKDWDIYSKKPKQSAKYLVKTLNKTSSIKNKYYTKPAIYPKTTKVMTIGLDGKKGTKDDVNIADYTKQEQSVKTVTKDGIQYAALSEIKKDRIKSLNDPLSKFRHEKDKNDLFLIKAAEYAGLVSDNGND